MPPSRTATGGRGSRRSGRPSSGRSGGAGCCWPAGRSSRSWPSCSPSCCCRAATAAPGAGGPAGPTGAALTALTKQVTSVPAATLDQVGAGAVTGTPSRISGAPLTSGGKPEMLYMGAEYCPYCAAERWSMIVALSRFGTFNGLTTTRSAARNGAGTAEPYPVHRDLDVRQVQLRQQVPDVHPGRGVHQRPRQVHRRLHHADDAHGRAAGAHPEVRRRQPGRDPVHRLREQVHERRRQLRPRLAQRPDLVRRSPPTCTSRRARSPGECSARPTT